MPKIIDTTDHNYIAYCKIFHPNGEGAYNGAYYYSKEIVNNIIPNVKTWRPWDTLGMKHLRSLDHAIVFIHHNLDWDMAYRWLDKYEDLVYVCSTKPTYDWAVSRGKQAVLLPLSIDVDYVKQFKVPKTKEAAKILQKELDLLDGPHDKLDNKDAAEYLQEQLDILDELAGIFPTR